MFADPLPHSAYFVIGVLVLMNLGAIGSMIWATGRIIWYFAKQDSKLNDVKGLGVRAHKRIDLLDRRVDELEES